MSRTLLSIQADFTNAVDWIVSILFLISCLSSLFSKFLRTAPGVLNTIDITFTFMFHCFSFQFSGKILVIIHFFSPVSFSLYCLLERQNLLANQNYSQSSDNPFVPRSPREYHGFHFLGPILVCVYTIDQHCQISVFCTNPSRGCPRGVMVKAMDCGIAVSEFVLQSRYYVHFRVNTLGKGMNPLILPAMG